MNDNQQAPFGEGLRALGRRIGGFLSGSDSQPRHSASQRIKPNAQALDVYWDPMFAAALEVWGEGNAWDDIQLLMASCAGRVLDIACGTGKVIEILSRYDALDLYGCDISDLLVEKALQRKLSPDKVIVCDATRTSYPNDFFDFAYSIGSLEHFTEEGITRFVAECYRIVRATAFHQVPVSRSGQDEGWIIRTQSYYNNSVDWWLDKLRMSYPTVQVLNSSWQDDISVGKWFVCYKNQKAKFSQVKLDQAELD